MKLNKLIENLTKIQSELGDVEVVYVDMRFGNAPVEWKHTVKAFGNSNNKCYIEIQGESDPKYENL